MCSNGFREDSRIYTTNTASSEGKIFYKYFWLILFPKLKELYSWLTVPCVLDYTSFLQMNWAGQAASRLGTAEDMTKIVSLLISVHEVGCFPVNTDGLSVCWM